MQAADRYDVTCCAHMRNIQLINDYQGHPFTDGHGLGLFVLAGHEQWTGAFKPLKLTSHRSRELDLLNVIYLVQTSNNANGNLLVAAKWTCWSEAEQVFKYFKLDVRKLILHRAHCEEFDRSYRVD